MLSTRSSRSPGAGCKSWLCYCNECLHVQVKHPGVLKVIEPLEETNGQMVMVTEPVFGSLANVLSQFREVPTAPQDRVGVTLSPLEAKYGLHTLAETLHFLHHEAHLVHCNINPGGRVEGVAGWTGQWLH